LLLIIYRIYMIIKDNIAFFRYGLMIEKNAILM